MEFIAEINAAMQSGFQKFKLFIEQKLHVDTYYLERPFWIDGGGQLTVLNYLIQQHQEKEQEKRDNYKKPFFDLTPFIDFILSKIKNKNTGAPLHQAIELGKIQLAIHLLDTAVFDVDRTDGEGRTLLSLVVETKNSQLLSKILKNRPNVNATTRMTDARVAFQPLHQAIALNFAFGVRSLVSAGADLANPLGVMKDTPLLLAARQGKIKALGALLEFPVEKLDLEAENNKLSADKMTGNNAMESLCKLLAHDKNNKDLIRGVAMLLCRGAEPPRKESMCQLLADKRMDLLKEIDRYLDTRPALVDPFVNRCHLADSALHKIIYVDHSWGNTLRQLFGSPSKAGFAIERLVTRKYSRRQEGSSEAPLSTVAAVPLKGDEPPLKLYAEFVRRYDEAYKNQRITNPWSTMRWMIAEGKCNWERVKQYAHSHPNSRTGIIYDDMFKTLPKMEMHEPIENATGTLQCNARL